MVRRNVPLAQQVMHEILSGIEAGTLAQANGLLPSEAELSQRYGVSRATLREALAQIENQGMIRRRHGVGTFVAQPLPWIEAGLEELESIHTMARRIDLETHSEALSVVERPAASKEAARLLTEVGTKVFCVARVICTLSTRVAFLVDIVPTTILTRSDLDDLSDGSVLDLILSKGRPALSHSRTEILVDAASPAITEILELPGGSNLMKHEAQLFSVDGAVVDYSLSYFVPGYFRFHVNRRVGKSIGAASLV